MWQQFQDFCHISPPHLLVLHIVFKNFACSYLGKSVTLKKSTAMRKSILISTVLTLFLLVPASITWAQTVSVTGKVYEKNTVKKSFKTPHGTITAILPDDMAAGDVISGMVLYEPGGTNQKKKKDNLEQLIKYNFFLESGTPVRANVNDESPIDWISEGNRYWGRFTVAIPLNENQTSLHLLLKDAENKVVGESRLPLLDKTFLMAPIYLDYGDVKSKVTTPIIQTDKNIYLSGENAAISLPLVFGKVDFEFSFISFASLSNTGQKSESVRKELQSLVGSPRKTVVQIPLNVYGPGEIILEDKNKKVIASQKIHVLQLEATSPKTNLMKGEQTMLNVTVKGLKDCPVDYLRLTLDNTTSGFVQLGQSNHEELILETVSMNYSKIKWDYIPQDKKINDQTDKKNLEEYESNKFSLQRSVTALQSGAFTLNVGLSYPSSVYNDPFRQQLDVLKTPEQFNNWQNALKNDLVQNFSGEGKHIKEGIISFTAVSSPVELNEAKSRAYNFVSWPRIGQEVVVGFFSCTLEAGNAAVQNAISNAGNAPVNIEVIESALKYAEHQAAIPENNTLKYAVINIKEDLSKLQKEINDVSQQLQILNNIQKVFHDASKAAVNNMRRSANGNTLSKVIRDGKLTDNEYLNFTYEKMSGNEIQIELGMGFIPGSLRDLMNSFITGQPVKKSGSFIAADINTKVNSVIDFRNALITEISFPFMDVKSKSTPMAISLKFKPEEISFKKETEKTAELSKPDYKKQWMPSNFKIEIEGLPCKEIKRVESFKITQKNVEEQIGPAKDNKIVPGKMEYPNLVFYVPDFDGESWEYWYSNFEKQKITDVKKGSIRYFDKNSNQVFALSFKNIIPVSVQPSRGPHPGGTYTVIVKPETTILGYAVSPAPLLNINASTYVANEIAGNPCNPEGAKTISWLYIEKPCRVEMKTTRSENVSPDSEEFLDEIADFLGEVSEAGAKMGTRLAKAFSITKSFAIWIEVVRDWEFYKAEYVCRNGVWQHGEMYLVNSGTKQVTYWERLTDESGQSSWTKDDDMGWIWRKANELKNNACK